MKSLAQQPNVIDDDGRPQTHVFDGVTITKETASFQLCDITDAMLVSMIHDEHDELRESCDERDGWFTSQCMDNIKTVIRHKFFSLLEGHIASDDECYALLTAEGSSKATAPRLKRLKAGKHNMAKGAVRAEDAAAERLRVALERKAKTLQKQRAGILPE